MTLEEALEKIRSMEVRGAGRIARFAASTIKDFTENSRAGSAKELETDVLEVFRKLDATRPTAVSLRNSLRIIHSNSILQFTNAEPSIQEMRAKIIEASEEFIKRSEGATENIGELGSDKVSDGFTIQTHCNSQNALQIIKHSFKQGKKIKVYATESRPWLQGHITVKELAADNIPVTLIVDSAVRYHMDRIDIVLVGADTITAEGNLINKIGTAQIALAAAEMGVPLYTCAETYKFSPESLFDPDYQVQIEERDLDEVLPNRAEFLGVDIANPVFDITPAKHITGIITEKGIIKPKQAKQMIETEFSGTKDLIFT
jgi:ribose 1,5-bisphosphate isomerase